MLVLIWLVVFALVGFSPVDTIPRPKPIQISRGRSSPEEQMAIGKTSRINLPISRLPDWSHDSCTFTGDISTQKSATRNEDLNRESKASLSLSAVALDQARSQSNRLLLQERQVCFPVCGKATVSPYDTLCCEEGQYCTTINKTPLCFWSTFVESQAFSSTSSTPTDVTTTSSSQIMGLSSATEGPSSTAEELPTIPSTLTTTVATPTTSAFPTQLSTGQSSSAASDTQTPTTGSSPSPSSLPSSSVTSSSSSSSTSSNTPTSGPTTVSGPVTSSGGDDAESNEIALGVGIGLGLPAAVASMIGAYFGVKFYYRRGL